MGMKFLNKKGWHTGSLRNIENVWKAEQKHGAEQKKLEELRKQIQEERERSEFRLLQEQAGLVPRQERLEFLYESGLAVGKGSSSSEVVFESLKPPLPLSDTTIPPPPPPSSAATQQQQQQPLVPGALFEEKPQSANDAWRKLHSDPLLLIRKREQESLARVKNNPVQMAIIRNSVKASKDKEKISESKDRRDKKRHKKKSKHHRYSSSDGEDERSDVRVSKRISKEEELSNKTDSRKEKRKKHHKDSSSSDKEEEKERSTVTRAKGDKLDYISERGERNIERRNHYHRRDSEEEEERSKYTSKSSSRDQRRDKIDNAYEREERKRDFEKPKYNEKETVERQRFDKKREEGGYSHHQASSTRRPYNNIPSSSSNKLSAEERAAKLREMQMDAEVHEENRWKRIKKADEIDSMQEKAANMRSNASSEGNSRNFLDAAKRSVYGAEKGGSSTIEESVRRRTHYSQSKSEVGQGNAFRR